jgi:hypothetical protein
VRRGSKSADLVKALGARDIHALTSDPPPDRADWTSLLMPAAVAAKFLDLVNTESDDEMLVARILGRAADLHAGEDPWAFEAVPALNEDGEWSVWIIVNIPPADLAEVFAAVRSVG